MNKSIKRLSILSILALAFYAIVSFTAVEPNHQGAAPHNCVATSSIVVICGGKYATKYHNTTRCRGLRNCKGGLYKMSIKDAKKKGFTACKICYE